MKNFTILIYLFLFSLLCSAQGGTWTWISGDSATNSPGVFGTQGVPSVNNYPPGVYEPAEWKDKQGNFWIYGGTYPDVSDLWKFNPATLEWTWVMGDQYPDDPPVYGTKGVPNPANTPGSRTYCTATWVDTAGNLWLFGGHNISIDQSNDLWKYNISSNEWTWVGGNLYNSDGVHGSQGVPSPSNIPGARQETASAWTDSLNNLWLFGGQGYDDDGNNSGELNDLMKYSIINNEWTWMKGSNLSDASVNYGSKGIANANNDPGARFTYSKWKDLQGNFWLMGGANSNFTPLNDVWEYQIASNEWIWMNGPDLANDSGKYQSTCAFNAINQPASRFEQRSSVTDNCGRFWLFGGFGPAYGSSENGTLSDLWVFNPSSGGQWSCLSGNNVVNQSGSYGTLGLASPSNIPPSRGGAIAWWGNDNRFYMFGGLGPDSVFVNTFSDMWVFNADTNCISFSSCAAAVVGPPTASFQSVRAICANDCINFTNSSTNATSWQWLFAGAADSTSTAQNPQGVCYLTAGVYSVMLIASNSTGSDTLRLTNYITVAVSPLAPVVTQVHNDTLFCSTSSTYTSYQWYQGSNIIAGATDTFLVISASGNYNVEVSNEDGCKISEGINIVLGVQNYMNDNTISLFPNPATDKLYVSSHKLIEGGVLNIYNVLGEVVMHSPLLWRGVEGEADVSSLSSGLYFVQLVSENERWVGKFVKE